MGALGINSGIYGKTIYQDSAGLRIQGSTWLRNTCV